MFLTTTVQLLFHLVVRMWSRERPRQVRFLLQAGADTSALIDSRGCEVKSCAQCVVLRC